MRVTTGGAWIQLSQGYKYLLFGYVCVFSVHVARRWSNTATVCAIANSWGFFLFLFYSLLLSLRNALRH